MEAEAMKQIIFILIKCYLKNKRRFLKVFVSVSFSAMLTLYVYICV